MKIVICGLGYVGTTMMACLLRDGHRVVGIDPNPKKVENVVIGRSPVSEPGVEDSLVIGTSSGRLHADHFIGAHLDDAEMVMVCVFLVQRAYE